MFRIHKERFPLTGAVFLSVFALVFALSHSLIAPIFPLFVKDFVGKEAYVGYFISFFAFLFLIANILIGKLLERIEKKKLMIFSTLLIAISYFIFTRIESLGMFIGIEMLRTFGLAGYVICLGLFIRESTNKSKIGKTEGLYFTFLNIAWLLGPLIGGLLAKAAGFKTVFYLSFLIAMLGFFVIIPYKNNNKENHNNHRGKLLENIKIFIKNKKLVYLYFITFGLVAFITLQYIYLPLLIKQAGFGEDLIGYALFALVIPLLLLEIPAGKLADKFGYRKFFIAGFIIMAAFLIATYFVNSIYLLVLFVILGSIGVAFIEPLKEAYFFKIVDKKDEVRLFTIHRTALQIATLISPLIYSTFLFFVSMKQLFVVAGFFILLFIIPAIMLKNLK